MLHDSPANPLSSGLDALLRGVAFAPALAGWIRVTGDDRVRWLNGMVTNSIQALRPGEGSYSFALNAQGRIQGDLMAWIEPDAVLLQTARPHALAQWLERYIIMDDVELTVLRESETEPADAPGETGGRAGLQIAGPGSASALTSLLPGCTVPESLHFSNAIWQNVSIEIFQLRSPLVPRFELWSGDGRAIRQLADVLCSHGVAQASATDLEHLRLLEGTPLFGVDIRDKDLPQETGQNQALHFSKGCYLGQEIVERIHSRGAVHRTFSGFVLEGEVPLAGTPLTVAAAPDKPIGEITSAAGIPLGQHGTTLALGYIRREALERNSEFAYPGGTAVSAALPFVRAMQHEPSTPETASQVPAR